MNKTPIEWCTHSLNPIRSTLMRTTLSGDVERIAHGHYCEKVSPGCANCYASRLQSRFGMPEFQTQRSAHVDTYLDEKKLLEPLRMRKPARIFWNDMSDLFGDWVPDEWIDRHFAVMALTPQHTHLVLTKRAKRMREYFARDADECVAQAVWARNFAPGVAVDRRDASPLDHWPLPNVHLGVSVESQKYADERIPDLLATPAAVRWVSAEPLLEAVNIRGPLEGCGDCDPCIGGRADQCAVGSYHIGALHPDGIHWVVVGGESGPGARPMHPDWVRLIRDQCQAAEVAFFFKQWGGWTPEEYYADRSGPSKHWRRWDGKGWTDEPTTGNEPDWMVRVGKKAAGAMLDGREWREYPR